MLNLRYLFNKIKEFKYVLVKTDVPYMPSGFPDAYPVGKDLDILCAPDDYIDMMYAVGKFIDLYSNRFEVVKKKTENGMKVRFLSDGKLHYQLHIEISEDVEPRILKNNYYVLPEVKEAEIRKQEYLKNPKKKWHLQYLQDRGIKI